MEVFGGFMMMLSIIGFFLAVIWFILPFVILNMKGKLDRTLELVESIDQRLAAVELRLKEQEARTGEPIPSDTEATSPELP
ncbi:hypothetical protein [Geomesophilobacter sediminis]|uniref:Uncharacterized protein n=1 Tax=Geomesophilobacter sediminis TaxID=2798584 RepID=A0A8J7M377_9BACT|nr:hypothetical protein [Geomesophilobacter sediminis]MBJ6727832.1 hypothetical protein [Geomesophilobacter sediminis]